MKTKAIRKRTKDCVEQFRVKKVGGDVIIEGFANKAVVDRGRDFIKPDAWKLDNFKKVPIILFNHDKDKPVGKAIDIRPSEAGLFIKCKISKSKDPTISMVRDLVEEGMLNAFSVGFDPMKEDKNADGVNEITEAELYETSIVSLPMNQDSVFSMSSKDLDGLSKEQAVDKILKSKGAWVAAAVQSRIYELLEAGGDRDQIHAALVEGSGSDMDKLTQVLAGLVSPVPEEILAAFSEVLGIEMDTLKELDEQDQKVEMGDQEKPETEPEEEPAPEEEPEEKPEEDLPEEEMGEKEMEEEEEKEVKNTVEVIAIRVPKSEAENEEEAEKVARSGGYTSVGVKDEGDFWLVLQTEEEGFSDDQAVLDLGDGISALVGVRQGADKEMEEEPKEPEEDMGEEKECEDEEKSLKTPSKRVDSSKKDSGAPISGGGDATIGMDENPHLAQARQTNILLGVLIEEMRGISSKLTGANSEKIEEPKQEEEIEEEKMNEEDEEMSKSIMDNLDRFVDSIDKRLKKIGA